ncbi:hypothetical protein PM10SUCC1_35430 [Propionigenium maris DSM 9537]|uniref:Uracil-DNA glycosylase n=1 Tax=Propionigenium maris DSM 9537 TaxID=1123000 RepID=A0A9W6GMY8_9FUSO|nr:uracil-DNA glycosylase [Propionigenium maris]GLI58029.1 hypothetical protein PM10SUCC1_35430 [Propionigenium maris DSM 9537]
MDSREIKERFLQEHRIHPSYYDFFTEGRVKEVEDILQNIGDDYSPKKENIFRVFRYDLHEKKVLLLGMDPYPQEGIATGFSFEVPYTSWGDKRINTSLKNMLKLLYKSYYGEMLDIKSLRERIEEGNFPILPPNEAFKDWNDKGVIFLNSALTVKVGKAGSHLKLWEKFTRDLFLHLGRVKPNLTYLIWGGKAEKFIKYISSGRIICHNHPAICGNLSNPKDFLNGTSFTETMEDIQWLG